MCEQLCKLLQRRTYPINKAYHVAGPAKSLKTTECVSPIGLLSEF